MSSHRKIRALLYEYLQNELSSSDRLKVETHVGSCSRCLKELDDMRSTLGILAVPATRPSEELSRQFWQEFLTSVVQKATSPGQRQKNPFVETLEWLEDLFALYPRRVFLAAGTCSALLVVFALWTLRSPADRVPGFHASSPSLEHPAAPALTETSGQSSLTPERVSQYFRKSKTLLVGVANLRTDQPEPIDFSKERRVSRDLIREARYLKQQPIDPRTRRLMNDMECILIELSNVEGQRTPSGIAIIRNGIHHENLLFKIRMAEAMYDSASHMYASDQR